LSAATLAALFVVQAVDDKLRPIAGQNFLFAGLSLAIVYPFFFLRSFGGQLLVLRRDDRRLISFGRAIQTIDNELGTIARQDVLLSGLFLTIVDFFSFLRPLRSHLLMLGCDGGRLALGLPTRSPGSRHHDRHEYHGGEAKDAHALILSVSGQVASESSQEWRLRRPPTSSRCTPGRTVSSALLLGPPRSFRFASGENPIEKSYRVCFGHVRALIVRRLHESIAFFERRGELRSAPRKHRPRCERAIAAEPLGIQLSRKTVGGKMSSP
jgi:hypothetical protein